MLHWYSCRDETFSTLIFGITPTLDPRCSCLGPRAAWSDNTHAAQCSFTALFYRSSLICKTLTVYLFSSSLTIIVFFLSPPVYLSKLDSSSPPPPPLLPATSRRLNERAYQGLIGFRENRNKQRLHEWGRISAAAGRRHPHTGERARSRGRRELGD